jgi:hypothetical protein
MGMLDRLFGRRVPLGEVVELTSISLFGNAVAQARGLIQAEALPEALGTDPQALNQTAWDLVLELVAFSLHWCDRVSFAVLGPAQRATFMDTLVSSVTSNLAGTILTDRSIEAEARFRRSFLELYSMRQNAYAECAVAAEEGAPLKGTLFWEAAKLVAARLFPEDPAGATLVLPVAFASCPKALTDLRGRLQGLGD